MQEPQRRRVLVVEDHLDTAVSTVLLVRGLGHDAESALNGFAALSAARDYRPHVVLLDMGLPDQTGWEVARALKRDPALRAARIIAVTGRAGVDDRARSMDAGCEQHLVKPVHPGVLEFLLGTA